MLPGYTILNRIYRGSKTEVYRASEETTNRPVIIKRLTDSHPTFEQLWQFRHQYTIARHLQHPQILEIYRLESDRNGYGLIMEDFGGISLREWIDLATSSLELKLQIAIDLTLALQELGQQRIIHKDINPANILIHPVTRQVKLIDFGIASLLPKETLAILNPNVLEGTLAYIAPEQTGRMNRGIDYRSDFYSLGVTLFELFTGELPFHAEDPIGWVYCHLAQIAVPADRINPDLPVAVSQIIAKLMAKNAEDRYQSALGIEFDLTECLRQLQETGAISGLRIGQRDLSNRFSIPERLYGRELAVQTLLAAFERVAQGSSELLLVAGCSGIGKTAVVNEIHKPIARQSGYFIKGKFDQFNRNIPFSALVRAFRDLIGQLLSESDAQVAAWKSQILVAVGENGRVLIEVIPELELIIGAQPPVAELAGTAAQTRFNLLFQRFITIFASVQHPLTIFLDDLQWADAASLQLLKLLVESKSYLLLLGAYRDNEVSPAHPLMSMLGELPQAGVIVETITLAPLTFDDTNQLVADTLHCSIELAKPLTASIDLKAHGNPLFITQFLKALHADGEIRFNPNGYWECDITRVQALAITDDVLEFISMQIQKLPSETQNVLKLAACIGDRFDLEVISIVSEQSQLSTANALWNGLQAGLILPTSQIYKFYQDLEDLPDLQDCVVGVHRGSDTHPTPNSTYHFLHDRVQQAAYSLIPESQRQQTHLQIGRLLLAKTTPAQQLEKIFEIVNHFNIAIALIQQPAEREMLAKLNLCAAQKARASNAYAAAYEYAQIGIEILGESGWIQQYCLTLALYETLADAAFLTGEFASIPRLFQIVLNRSKTPLDRVKSYETIIRFHAIQKQYSQAILRGLEILQQLGIKLSPQPNRLVLLRELALTKIALWGKSTDRLLNLPETVALEKIAPMRILDLLQAPAFFCSQELMAVLSLVGIRLTLRDGNTPWSAAFYSVYCIINSGLGELKQAYRFSQLAMMLADRFVDLSVTTRVQVIAAWYANPWHEQLRTTIPLLEASIGTAIESSNLQYIGINAGVSIVTRLFAGIPLPEIVDRIPKIIELVTQSNDENSQEFLDLVTQTIFNLYVPSTQPTEILKKKDKLSSIARWQANNESLILSNMYGLQTLLAYHFEDIPNALIYADAQLPYERAATGGYTITQIWMFDALTRLAAYPHSDKRGKKQLLDRVKQTQRQLGKRARSMPANFQHQYDLVEAEKCRVLGDFTTAIELYDRTISGAKTHEFLHEEAVANECAAKFYLGWGKEKIAAVYMQSAYYCYLRWGARAKTALLEQRYPQLLAPILRSPQSEFNSLATLTKITNSLGKNSSASQSVNSFDLSSVLQSAQAISSTLALEELIQQLSQIILENSGAQICIPILRSHHQLVDLPPETTPDDRHRAVWQVYDRTNPQDLTAKFTRSPLETSSHLPLKLIDRVRHHRQTIILNRGTTDPSLFADDYLSRHQPQSAMCLPLLHRGELLGLIYLENRDTADVFTTDRQIALEFLASQAAITLHNAQLYESVVQRSAAIEASLDGFAILEHDRFIYVNKSHADMFGYTVAESIDLHWHHLYSPAQIHQIETIAFPAVSKFGRWRGEAIATRKDGSTFDEEITLFLLDNGQLICICRDITEQKTALRDRQSMEVALRESEARYHQLVSNIPAALYQFELTADGISRMNYLSARFSEMFEISAAAALSDISVLFDRVIPADRQSFERSFQKSTRLGKYWLWEGRVSMPSGKIKWIRGESRPTANPDGSIVWDGMLLDVTDRKQAERELKLTQFAVDNSADGIAWLRIDGSFAYVNKAMCRMLGYSVAELCTLHIWDIDLETSPHTWPQHWQQLRATGGFSVEAHHQSKCGHSYPVEISLNYFEFEGEEYNCTRIRDVTDAKAAELALRQSEERYHKLSDNIPGVIYQFRIAPDGSTSYPYVSSGCWELFQLTPAAVMADSTCAMKMIHPEDLAYFERVVAESAQNMTPKLWEGRAVLKSGEIKWIKCVSRPELQADGSIVWDGVMLDITERKQAEIELLASKQFLQTVLDSFPLFIFWKDRNSVYLGGNQKFVTGAGLQDSIDLIGKTDYDLPWDAAESDAFRADDLETIETEIAKLGIIETQVQLDGSRRWLETNKVPLRNPEGEVMGLVGTYQDVTERQQAQLDLNLTNERLELTVAELQQATRLKDEFLATMSHELRTPLNAILGMSEALLEEIFGSLNARQLNSISTIEQSGEHLLSLINDILDVSKITAGKLELNLTQVSLADLCKSSLIIVKQQAFDKQIHIDTHLPTDLDLISIDERRMRQVLINLLNNAVKFTPKGGLVTLSVSIEPIEVSHQTAGYALCFAIRDTGIGIAKADMSKLFQPFIQIDSSLSRKYEGTGLGLVLVKQIVELHGGTVSIDSEVGTGSCFTVRLPQLATIPSSDPSLLPPIPPVVQPTPSPLPSPNFPLILLAEDNEVNINTFSSYLTAKGYRIIWAQNGREAIALTQSHHPNLILMDIHMPDMDGIEAIRCIRQQSTMPIIAIAASVMEGERDNCLAVGANKYLTKPVKLRELHCMIQACLDLT